MRTEVCMIKRKVQIEVMKRLFLLIQCYNRKTQGLLNISCAGEPVHPSNLTRPFTVCTHGMYGGRQRLPAKNQKPNCACV